MEDEIQHDTRPSAPEGGEAVSAPELISFHLKDKVEYVYPGAFFSERSSDDLSGRSADDLAKDASTAAFAFRTFKILEGKVKIGNEIVDINSSQLQVSGTTYIDGEVYDVDRIKAEIPDNQTLVANLEGRYSKAVRTRMGNWQPFTEKDSVISTKPQ